MPLDTANERLCDDCGVPLVGRYCHACGEDSQPPRRALKDLLSDGLDNVFSFTEHVPHTLRDLLLDPGRILRGLRDGDRKRYLSPFKLYVSATVVFFLFLAVTGVSFFQIQIERDGKPLAVVVENGKLVRVEGFRATDQYLHRSAVAPRDPQAIAAIEAAIPKVADVEEQGILKALKVAADRPSEINQEISDWAPRLLWLLMPLYALLIWPLYRKSAFVSDHLIFALWAHTSLFLLLILGALWNLTGLGGGLTLALLGYQAYLTVGLKGYYGRGWTGAVLKGGLHSLVYFGLIWIPLMLGFAAWQVGKQMPPGYWE